MQTKNSLEGKIAVVTGGGGVLGGAMAKGLAAEGGEGCIVGTNVGKIGIQSTGN